MSGLFHLADDVFVILHSRGVFRQAKGYYRAGYLYAGVGSGFLRLYEKGGTSAPNVRWEELHGADQIPDNLGRLRALALLPGAAS